MSRMVMSGAFLRNSLMAARKFTESCRLALIKRKESQSHQVLGNRRIDTLDELNSIISDWERDRNKKQIGVSWQFTAEDARIKLKRLYPSPIFDTVLDFTGHY